MQISYLCELHKQYPYLWEVTFHPKNEGSKRWNKAKMGNSAGVLDLFIMHPVAPYHGFMIELKSSIGKISVNQKMWMDNLKAEGYYVCWANNLEDAMYHVRKYLMEK